MEQKKVKLPREVAEALDEVIKEHGRDQAEYIALYIPIGTSNEKHWTTLFKFSGTNGGFFKLIDALRYGYEIEPEPLTVTITPEQQSEIKEYLGSLDPAKASDELKIKGFIAALDLADIKIPGVND